MLLKADKGLSRSSSSLPPRPNLTFLVLCACGSSSAVSGECHRAWQEVSHASRQPLKQTEQGLCHSHRAATHHTLCPSTAGS